MKLDHPAIANEEEYLFRRSGERSSLETFAAKVEKEIDVGSECRRGEAEA
jgi:hypothetical protein